MKECAKCRRCYDDSHIVCPNDDKPLVASINCNVLISGRYLLEERLGKGGMGIVFKAKHKFLKSSHAIKLILPSLVEDDDALLVRFKQEAILAASIDHPNVIRVTDFGVEDETMPYLVMEFVDGSPLSSYLVKGERLTPERAFELFQPIALGVAEAHSRGITHRDLKPQNIMVVKGLPLKRAIKVLDFGLAKIKSTESFGSMIQAETMSNVIGSPPYMSPEQWENNKVDHRTDIYGLGVILYQMLTGNLPFQGDSVPSIMYQHLTVDMPQFASHGVSLSPQLEAVVARALQKDRENRPDTIEEMLAEFEEALKTVDVPLTVSIPAEQLKSFGHSSSPKNEKSDSYSTDEVISTLSETQKEKLYSYFNSSAKADLLADEQLAWKFLDAQSRAEEAEKQISDTSKILRELLEAQKAARISEKDALEAKNAIETDVRQRVEAELNNRLTTEHQNRQKVELQKLAQEIAARKEAGQHTESLARAALVAQTNAEAEYKKAENQARQSADEENVRRAVISVAQLAQQIHDAKIRYQAAAQQAEYEAELRKSAEDKWLKIENELQILIRQDGDLRNAAETEVQKQIHHHAEPFINEAAAARRRFEEAHRLTESETAKLKQSEGLKALAEEEVQRLAQEIRSTRIHSNAKTSNSSGQNLSSNVDSQPSYKSQNPDDEAIAISSSNQQTLPAVQTAFEASQGTVKIQARNSDENFKSFVNTDSIPKRKMSLPVILAGVFGLMLVAAVGGYGVYKFVTPNSQNSEPNVANKSDDKPVEKPIEKLPDAKTEIVSIKGGTFQMGRNDVTWNDLDWGDQFPAHPVTVKSFNISKNEVSNEEYAEFIKATEHPLPKGFSRDKTPEGQEKMPVTFVSLTDAKAYADWISKRDNKICRLPTEEEWEYVARNGEQQTDFPWGNEWSENLTNVATGKVAKVGTSSDETIVGGVKDMMGNVIEWTSSKYALYPGNGGSLGSSRQEGYVARASSWGEPQNRLKKANLLLTRRQSLSADTKSAFLGFRIVCQP